MVFMLWQTKNTATAQFNDYNYPGCACGGGWAQEHMHAQPAGWGRQVEPVFTSAFSPVESVVYVHVVIK